jgi:hypothetical protein
MEAKSMCCYGFHRQHHDDRPARTQSPALCSLTAARVEVRRD